MSTKTQIKKSLAANGWKAIDTDIMQKYIDDVKHWCYFYKVNGKIPHMNFQKKVDETWKVILFDACQHITIENDDYGKDVIRVKGYVISYVPTY
jgi:hypothetical protein